ncbi:MAG TPA: SRPBCC domain-containing protein [Flavobacteriales bacterium]|nr:SRPBCC domain-containing protein [Flavobacteriales bacterium]
MEKENHADRTLSLKKTLNAPVSVVWEAWTRPEHLLQWWAPPGMKTTIVEHNFTVGGKWKYAMPMPDGSEFISEGTYKEIVEHKKIVTTADFRPMTEGVEMHIEFEADGDKTHFTFSIVHATVDYKNQQEKMGFYNGWGSAFNRLEEHLQVAGHRS